MNLSENFVKSIAIDADQVYNNRNAKTGRNMQRINPGAGLPDTAFKLYHWLEHALEFMGINSMDGPPNLDQYGYDYGYSFNKFNALWSELPPTTIEGQGSYFHDDLNGNYYEEYFFNINSEPFGGDGSFLLPAYYKTITANNLLSGNSYTLFMLMANNGIEFNSKDNIFTDISSNIVLNSGAVALTSNYTNGSTNVYLNDTFLRLSHYDYFSSNFKEGVCEINKDYTFLQSYYITDGGRVGVYTSETGSLKQVELKVENEPQGFVAGAIKVIADVADAVQPIKINISGINTYVDLTAAIADGLTSGDLFIIGNTLSIVP